jgi:hypothetical protein
VEEERQQYDDRNRDAEQPEKNSSTHDGLHYIGLGVRTRSFHVPSRSEPPSTAARLAANAPNNMAAVNQKESLAATFRASSAALFSFGNHVIEALLGIGLAHSGAHSDDLRHICFVGVAEVLVVLKTCGPQSLNF